MTEKLFLTAGIDLAERNERKPVIITTNKGFGDWTEIFGDPSLTAALLDRVTHKAHVINCRDLTHRDQSMGAI